MLQSIKEKEGSIFHLHLHRHRHRPFSFRLRDPFIAFATRKWFFEFQTQSSQYDQPDKLKHSQYYVTNESFSSQ